MRWWWPAKKRERNLARELQAHLDLETEEQQAFGLSPEAARYAAQRATGNTTLIKEVTREIWGWASLERFWQDLHYALRMLRKAPGFTCVAVLSLALGIGANTAIFSLLNAVVFRPLPVRDPQQLVQFTYTGSDNWNSYFGYPQFERFRADTKTLTGVFGGTRMGGVSVAFRGTAALAQGDAYSDNFFTVLGIAPQHGRLFAPGDDQSGASVAVLSDRYWRLRFSADPSVVGATVSVNQIPFTVIGITPPEFSGIAVGYAPDVWVPLHALDRLKPDSQRWTESFASWMAIAGRLQPAASIAQAQSELDVIHRRLLAEQLAASERRSSEVMQRFVRESHLVLRSAKSGLYSGLRNNYAFPLTLLMGVAGIVLLVACANVANLLLARAASRRREIAVRLALGAGRGRLIRQLLTETILLAAIGGVLAVPAAWWGSAALVRMISTGDSPLPLDVRPDLQIFGFTAAVSLLTGILFGLAPAIRGTRMDPGPTIKEGSRQAGRSSHLLDRVLVVAQVALSVVLIAGAGLFMRTLQNLQSVNLGYDRENVLMFSVDTKLAGYPADRAGAVYREILRRLQALPDVRLASASIVRPVDDQFDLINRVDEIDGRSLPERNGIRVVWNAMSPGYFSTVSTPILLGRDFDPRDNETSPQVVIVNESLAARAFPGQNPIGHKLDAATIIGVVRDSRYKGARDQPRPTLYHPLFQHGKDQEYRWGYVSFELRCHATASLLDQVRREVASVDRNLPIFRVKTLQAQAAQSLLRERLLAMLSSFFGALALLLACIGLYGLMAHAVARRIVEIGIRMALGARRGHIMWTVLRETLFLTLAGAAAGIPLALWTAQYTKALLFGVTTADPLTLTISITTLIAVALLAGYIPARRAVSVDPMVALRYE